VKIENFFSQFSQKYAKKMLGKLLGNTVQPRKFTRAAPNFLGNSRHFHRGVRASALSVNFLLRFSQFSIAKILKISSEFVNDFDIPFMVRSKAGPCRRVKIRFFARAGRRARVSTTS
jgi:hypothetical protein